MVQESGRRQRNRLERHRAFLDAARSIAFAEGLDALTMQRLAAEVDCAVGTAYTYFPSKSALVAEVQREAIEALGGAYLRFRDRFRRSLAGAELDAAVTSLAHLVGFARFWIAAVDTLPEESRLLQLLMAEPSPTVDEPDLSRVVPSAMTLLGFARDAFDDAAAQGALEAGDAMERTIVLAAALNGVLLVDRLARIDPDLFDGSRLARSLVDDLLRGWGADTGLLASAKGHIDRLARRAPLATQPQENG